MLKVENLCVNHPLGTGFALENISFSLNTGDILSLVGPTDCGKSMILSVIAGFNKPASGSVFIGGCAGDGVSKEVGFMLKKDSLLDWRTIYNNIKLGLDIRGKLSDNNISKAESLLKKYGLYEYKDKYPPQLSVAIRQRAALIRALATNPKILLLDNVFSDMDPMMRSNIADDIYNIIKKEKTTVVMITDDTDECIQMSDKVLLLSKSPTTVQQLLSVGYDLKMHISKTSEIYSKISKSLALI